MGMVPEIRILPLSRVDGVLEDFIPHALVSIITADEIKDSGPPVFSGYHIHAEMWDVTIPPLLIGGGPDHSPSLQKIAQLVMEFRKIPVGGRVVFHYLLGQGRSPAAAMIFLMERGLSEEEARTRVMKLVPFARPNTFMLSLYKLLRGHERSIP